MKKIDSTESKRPDFLFILTDQWHPGCFGYAGHPVVRTPHIDRLAASGIHFSRTYTAQPLCMPARASLLTGLTPRGHGVRMNGIPLDKSIETFTAVLGRNGYRTHSCGKVHLDCKQRGATPDPENPTLHMLWEQGKLGTRAKQTHPVYGFDGYDYCGGHSFSSNADYTDWLKREHPEEAHLFFDTVPLEPPGPARTLFNRSSFKWALPAALHPAHWITDRTLDFLEDAARRKETEEDDHFFLVCSIQDPHPPFAPPKEYAYLYDPAEVPPPVGREGELDDLPPHFRQMREDAIKTSGNPAEPMNLTDPHRAECAAHYYGLISLIDDQVGRILQKLEDTGLRENTIVVFLADHGEALGDHGMWGKGPYHFDSVIRVPHIVSCPSRFAQGVEHRDMIGMIDFAPTILDLAGIPIPEGDVATPIEAPQAPPAWPGKSFRPILENPQTDGRKRVLVEMDEDYLGFKMRTLVTPRYRLTCYSGHAYGELFDLQEDPQELRNLWDDPSHRQLRDALHIELLQEIMLTDISLPRQIGRS